MPVYGPGLPRPVRQRKLRSDWGAGIGSATLATANLASALFAASIISANSTTNADGSTDTFSFTVPIGTLWMAFAGGALLDPGECFVVGGALKLTTSPLPGDPANPTLIKITAVYVP